MSRTYLDFADDLQIRRAVNNLEAERDALLEALRDLADTNNDFSEALVRARLAIAKATTGEQS